MSVKKVVGLVLVLAGVFVLVSHGFDYTKQTHKGNLGSLDFSLKEKRHVAVPTWAGVLAVAAGVALLILPLNRDR